MAVADEVTSGWLLRRGPTAMHNWKEQWCVLRSGKLILHRDEKCLEKLSSLEIGPQSRALRFGNHRAPGDAVKHRSERPFGFVLDTNPTMGKDRKLVYLDAKDLETLDRWLQAFQQAMQAVLGKRPHRPAEFLACSFNVGKGQTLPAESFKTMPSVATWYIKHTYKRWRTGNVALPQAPSTGGRTGSLAFQRLPSVATWMRHLKGM